MSTPTFASLSDRAILKALWCEAFDDEPQEVDAFLDRFFSDKTALVMREDGRVVSMLFLLPSTVVIPHERRKVGYIYGGATCKQDRGKGHYRRLLSFAQAVAAEQGLSALFLHPADDRLDDSYRRLGFTVPLFASETAACPVISRREATSLTAAQYVRMRRRLLNEQQAAYIDWDETVLTHCLSWSRAYAFGQSSCALVSDDWATVYEYIGADANNVYVPTEAARLPVVCRGVGEQTVVGRLYPLDELNWETPIYMGYGME